MSTFLTRIIRQIPLYMNDGKPYPFSVDDLLAISPKQSSKADNWEIQVFEFGEQNECYIKSALSGNLHRVVAFEISQEIVRKI